MKQLLSKSWFKLFAWPLLRGWYFLYRFRNNYKADTLPEMFPKKYEGYTSKPFFSLNEPIIFYLKGSSSFSLIIEKITGPYQYQQILRKEFDRIDQITNQHPYHNGAGWKESFQIEKGLLSQGYYRAILSPGSSTDVSHISFGITGPEKKPEVAIIAPVSTWLAYNPYGGKSAYKNIIDKKNIHKVSNQRPNSALQYKEQGGNIHDMNVEANIYNWFSQNYSTILLPDTALEKKDSLLNHANVIVLSYHCEYFSPFMYKNLRKLVHKKNKSLINLGANQIYWKILYNRDKTSMEVRKDNTWFDKKFMEGGLWRQTFYPEGDFLGVQFTDPGTGSYAPYQITAPTHWLYKNTNVNKGDLFGLHGINNLPICGDETDKAISNDNALEIIAEGLNCKEQDEMTVYPDRKYNWNGEGGGVIALKKISNKNAILTTGSIQSGSGLGTDKIFTSIIHNFIKRYCKER